MKITPAQPSNLPKLLTFREEAATWLRALGPTSGAARTQRDRLLATIESGTVFMLRDGAATAGTITLTTDAEDGLWTSSELSEPSMFINKLTVARTHAGQGIGGRLLDWAGDQAQRAGAA